MAVRRRCFCHQLELPDSAGDVSTQPGRLGDPNMKLYNDPRLNPLLLEALRPKLLRGRYGMVGEPLPGPIGPRTPVGLCHAWNRFVERRVLAGVFAEMPDLEDDPAVEEYSETIAGVDGNSITLYIAKPRATAPAPGILHMHGGGMSIMSANDPPYRKTRRSYAQRGFVTVSVEFRNSSGVNGPHAFPAGLNDCMSALAWVHARRGEGELGITKLVLSGESGGGNLCTAMAIRAKREGRLHELDGVYAMCPFIAGPDAWAARSLPSMVENDTYFVDCKGFVTTGKLYDPSREHADDPCAWPLKAKTADLEGLPPHFVSVNELDPLRDEGLAYCEALRKAGVRAESRLVAGTPHAGDMGSRDHEICRYIFDETVDSLMAFAESL